LPPTLGNLSDADLACIAANHGSPYTEDYNLVFQPPLAIDQDVATFQANVFFSTFANVAKCWTFHRQMSRTKCRKTF
jgi:hypothetical protein